MFKLLYFFTLISLGGLSAQTKAELFARPGVIGDSLSQGFFGVTVEKKITRMGISRISVQTSWI
jgi:hypothetical protein